MNKKLVVAFISAILICPLLAHGQDEDDRPVFRPPVLKPGEKPQDADFSCPYLKSYQHPEQFAGFTVRLLPGFPHTKVPTDRCRARVTSPKGIVTMIAKNWALTLDKISGADINGDGKPELVIDGYSGGEHCCFTYTIVKLGGVARILRKIESSSALTFEKQEDGTVVIRGVDSSLDYFLVPHEMAVVPLVFLRMEGSNLVNVSAQFQPQYDKLIEEARGQLTTADLEKFRQSRYTTKLFSDQLPTVRRVLVIVLNYLYSGREAQAWQSLQELWPPSDQSRIKALILERRARGLLKQVDQPKPGA